MTNQKTPEQSGATEEQIEAATWALIDSDTDVADRGVSDEHYRERRAEVERIAPILAPSAPASAHPADERHDAEEREVEFDRPCERDHVGICRNCGKGIDARHVAYGIYEPCSSPLTLPAKPNEREAEPEDQAATETGEREKLIAEASRWPREQGVEPSRPPAELINDLADALAAPVEVGSRRVEYLFVGHPGWPDPIISEDEAWARRWFEEHRSKHPVRVDRRVIYRSEWLRG